MPPFLREPVALCTTDDLRRFSRQARIHRDLEGGGGLVRDLTIGDPKMPGIAHRIWQASFSDVAGQNETPLVSLTIRRLSVSIFAFRQSFV
jgi:hypothetical protein